MAFKKVIIYRSTSYKDGKQVYHYYADKDFAKSELDSFHLEQIAVRIPADQDSVTLYATKED